MERVAILGRGGAGKTTAARRLGAVTGLPVVELDEVFWRDGPTPLPPDAWEALQRELAAPDRWILDGDLGPYDAPAVRLARADTVIVLDFSLARCAWRALRRSRERADFWWWLVMWRHRSRAALLEAIATHAGHAGLHVVRTPRELDRLPTSGG